MPNNSTDTVSMLVGEEKQLLAMNTLPAFPPFSKEPMALLSEVSRLLLADSQAKTFPDVVTFAFFCRRAALEKLASVYPSAQANRLGRGLTFHIAPSNVPVNFAYSLVAALLAGNACIVRAPSKAFPQTDIICQAFRAALSIASHAAMHPYVAVLRYPKNSSVTAFLSSLCDVRVIWGGDATIEAVRRHPLPARSFDLCFADRYSLALIDASTVLALDNDKLSLLAQGFYNDTYLFDQNACSSPRLILWTGPPQAVADAKKMFWEAVHRELEPRYSIEPVMAVDKLDCAYRCALDLECDFVQSHPDNRLVRVQLRKLVSDITEYRSPGGFFLEYDACALDTLFPIVTRRYQTLAVFGHPPEQVAGQVKKAGLCGIDRVVAIGETSSFSLTWDGYDLIETFSRIVAAG